MSTVDVGGVPFACQVHGEGPPLLLVAGTGYPGATWRLPHFLDALSRHHLVITYDHRGTGRTPGSDDPYHTRGFAADAAAILRALDVGPAHVVGHSMGGRVAQWLALDTPDLVRSLVLAASGPGGAGNPGQPRGLPLPAVTAMVEHGYRGYMEQHIRSTFFTESFAVRSPERVAWLVEAFWHRRPDVRNYLKHIEARQNHDTSDRLRDISVPTLVLVGDADVRRGPTGSHFDQSLHLSRHIRGAALEVLPDLSHGIFWQAPDDVVAAVTRWTERVEQGGPGAGHGGSALAQARTADSLEHQP
jgi:pimeloyl-ACP methyl ester carboxylesterase